VGVLHDGPVFVFAFLHLALHLPSLRDVDEGNDDAAEVSLCVELGACAEQKPPGVVVR
jgi:hypothetical protein